MLLGDGGCLNKIKLLSQIFIFSFGVENVIIQIAKGSIQEKFLTDALPFFIIPIIFQFINTKIIFSIVFLAISSILIIISEEGVFDGAILLIFSVYIFKNNKFDIIALIIVSICISINSLVINLLPSQMFLLIKLYAFMYLIYFFTIRSDQKKHDTPDVTIPDIYISPDEKHLIELLFAGNTRQEIYSIMGKSKTSINSYQNNLLVKLQAKTFEEVLLKLGKSVKIKENSLHADN